jgi:aldehyde:ferredoxin oxidoreductase
MRKYLHIDLTARSVESTELHGEALTQAGRYFIAKTLLEGDVAEVDPLGPENPLIFSAGPFAGTNFSNANRLSVGCKSPLTGGIKEANAGGTFAVAMGHLEIAGFTLRGAGDEWVVIRIPKEGPITFDSAEPYMGKGNFEAAALLHETYGDKTSIALCGSATSRRARRGLRRVAGSARSWAPRRSRPSSSTSSRCPRCTTAGKSWGSSRSTAGSWASRRRCRT